MFSENAYAWTVRAASAWGAIGSRRRTRQRLNDLMRLARAVCTQGITAALCGGVLAGCVGSWSRARDASTQYSAAADRPGPDFDVLHYDVQIAPQLDGRIDGQSRIAIRSLRDDLREVRFSTSDLDVRGVNPLVREVARSNEDVVVTLSRALRQGEVATVVLAFFGTPSRGYVANGTFAYTDYWACAWMPCTQDRPGDKATLTLSISTPPGIESLGPGALVSSTPQRDGAIVHIWRLERPHPSYLFAFAVGRFAESRVLSPHLEARAFEPLTEELAAAFTDTERMRAFFSAAAGLPLPSEPYIQLVVPGAVAQESATHSSLGLNYLAAMRDDPSEDWLVAHELAHQWWGNLVTCASWRDFWLNEGIVTFMVAAWKEQRWGRHAYDREMMLARRRLDGAVAAGFDVPLTFEGRFPNGAVRRAIAYSKGALFMDVLRTRLGEERFWAGLREFTRANAGGVVDSRDFQVAMEAAAGEPLQDVFDAWVY